MITNLDPRLTRALEAFCKKAGITHTEFITTAATHLIALIMYHPDSETILRQVEQYVTDNFKK